MRGIVIKLVQLLLSVCLRFSRDFPGGPGRCCRREDANEVSWHRYCSFGADSCLCKSSLPASQGLMNVTIVTPCCVFVCMLYLCVCVLMNDKNYTVLFHQKVSFLENEERNAPFIIAP